MTNGEFEILIRQYVDACEDRKWVLKNLANFNIKEADVKVAYQAAIEREAAAMRDIVKAAGEMMG